MKTMTNIWRATRGTVWIFGLVAVSFVGAAAGAENFWMSFALMAMIVGFSFGMVYMANCAIARAQAPSYWAIVYLAGYWLTLAVTAISLILRSVQELQRVI